MEIWKKMWVGVFFLNTVYYQTKHRSNLISHMTPKSKPDSIILFFTLGRVNKQLLSAGHLALTPDRSVDYSLSINVDSNK